MAWYCVLSILSDTLPPGHNKRDPGEIMTKVRMRGWISFALVFFVAITTSEYGWTQVAATISGKVEDASGAAIGGANVTVKSLETGASRTVSTDETGNYRALS